jgi:hypothetical protein
MLYLSIESANTELYPGIFHGTLVLLGTHFVTHCVQLSNAFIKLLVASPILQGLAISAGIIEHIVVSGHNAGKSVSQQNVI